MSASKQIPAIGQKDTSAPISRKRLRKKCPEVHADQSKQVLDKIKYEPRINPTL